jgi:hypothetical protein
MLIITKGCISHNGLVYKKGEVLPEMPRADELRLLDLGVCIEGAAPKAITPQETQSGEPTKTSNDLNLDFNPEDTIVGKK